MTSDPELTDRNGRPLTGRALELRQAAAVREREQAAAERERRLADRERELAAQEQRSRDASRMTVTALGGPDAVIAVARQQGDPERARRLLEAAGLDAAGIMDRWRAQEPAQRRSSPWAGDPAHDPRVAEALQRGVPDAELARVMAGVAEEYAGRAAEKEARRREYYGLDMPRAAIGVSVSEFGAPVQRSQVHTSVPPLGSEQ